MMQKKISEKKLSDPIWGLVNYIRMYHYFVMLCNYLNVLEKYLMM